VISQNAHRRHLTTGERKQLVTLALSKDPTQSDRLIARSVGVAPNTVKAQRRSMESTAQIAQLASRKGRDGKTRPMPLAHTRKVSIVATQPDTDAKIEQVRSLVLSLCQILRDMAPEEGEQCLIRLETEFKAFGALYLPLKPQRSSHRTYGGPVDLPHVEPS
jgi:DNA-binding CsgD family transcriptional regulator